MVAFWSALLGAFVGGGLGLAGVWLTLRKQVERDKKADERHLRDRKHDRLRAAYRDVVSAAENYPRHALVLGILEIEGRRKGDLEPFYAKLQEGNRDIGEARSTLLLETKEDRVLLEQFGAIATDHLVFLASLAKLVEEDGSTAAEYTRWAETMQTKADALAEVARTRLAKLDEPVE